METEIKRQLTLPNDVKQVPLLAEFIDGICEAASVDMMLAMQINLAIEEVVVNVMNYAYPAGTEGTVTIDAQVTDGLLQFVVSDSGVAFDPTAKGEVDTTLSAEERSIGGLGIHIVRQIMDSINYKREGDRNVLTLVKKL